MLLPSCNVTNPSAQEVAAARTICERGVLLVGTAHGSSLGSLLRNPELRPLVGGVQAVTLGDAEAKNSNNGQKVRQFCGLLLLC
jgi:stage III sporulation protein SpoIIIAA